MRVILVTILNYHLILCYRHALLLIHEKIKSFVLIIRVFQREMVCHLKIGEPILQLYCLTTTQRYYLPTYTTVVCSEKKWVLWSLGHLPWAQEDLPSNICHILNSKREGYICFWGNIISKLAPQISDSLHHFCLWETEWVQ